MSGRESSPRMFRWGPPEGHPCDEEVSQSGSPSDRNAAPALLMRSIRSEQFPRRAAEPVKLGDQHDVTRVQRSHKLRQLRPIGPGAADLLPEDRGSAGRRQRFELAGEMLILRRDSGVTDNRHLRAPLSQVSLKPVRRAWDTGHRRRASS